MTVLTSGEVAGTELIMSDHDGPGVIPGRYPGPAIPISTGPTPQQITEAARKAAADRLAGQICAAAALSAQATCTLLELVAEFDATGAIGYWTDLKSVAHWLAWTCSMTPHVAREHVRVARALPKMPTVHAAFRAGRLSYSKVREISRVVDIIDETKLCQMATTATAAQLATMIAAFRSCHQSRMGQHTQRSVTWRLREDGMVDLRARLTKEDAAILTAAIHAAQNQYGTIPPKPDPSKPDLTHDEPLTPGVGAYTTTDALVDVARVFLDTAPEDRSGEDRTLVVVHVSADLLNPATADENVPAGTSAPQANICHLDGQGPLEPVTAQRLACDNPILPAITTADGDVLHLGRTRRLVSRAQRRALMIRDRSCQHPGCHQTRHLKAHHIQPWAKGGATDLNNLILLCQFHHTTVHEGGLTITRSADQRWEFTMPDGTMCQTWHTDIPLAHRLRYLKARQRIEEVDSFHHPDAQTIRPRWAGEPFNIYDCVQALYTMKLPATPEPEDQDQQAA